MRFEKSIAVDAPQQRVWDVLSALEAWPQRIETVDIVELLTPAPITKGSRVRLKQPKLPEGTWDITVWDAPSYFEWTQKTGGTTSVAGHRVEAVGEGRARLTLTLDMRGFLIPIIALFYKDLTDRYMNLEAEGMSGQPNRPRRPGIGSQRSRKTSSARIPSSWPGSSPRLAASCAAQRLPRFSCSRSMASNSALKLPTPKPREPCRSMISKKKVGRSCTGLVKIWSR